MSSLDVGKIDRLYYGAGNCRSLLMETLSEIVRFSIIHKKGVDVETDSLEDVFNLTFTELKEGLPKTSSVILFFSSFSFSDIDHYLRAVPERVDFIKGIVDNEIVWVDTKTKKEYRTFLDDPLFDQDVYV